jgi:hypothetical protein
MSLLLRAIYVSEVNIARTQLLPQIRLIEETSRKNNTRDNMTGMLLFNDRFFVQVIEGPRLQVTNALARIFADERHDRFRLASAHEIHVRSVKVFSTKYLKDPTKWTLPTSGRAFDPSEASADDLLDLVHRETNRLTTSHLLEARLT